MGGKCFASRISGAVLVLRTELGAPGVPDKAALALQFCPALRGIASFTSSSELPKPSAAENHDQPEALLSTICRQMITPVACEAGEPLTIMLNALTLGLLMVNRPLY